MKIIHQPGLQSPRKSISLMPQCHLMLHRPLTFGLGQTSLLSVLQKLHSTGCHFLLNLRISNSHVLGAGCVVQQSIGSSNADICPGVFPSSVRSLSLWEIVPSNYLCVATPSQRPCYCLCSDAVTHCSAQMRESKQSTGLPTLNIKKQKLPTTAQCIASVYCICCYCC